MRTRTPAYDKRLVNLGYGLPDKLGSVEPDKVLHAFGELLAHLRQSRINLVGDSDGVCLGKGKDHNLGRAESAQIGKVRVILLAQINAGNIAEAHDLSSCAGHALHDDIFKLDGIGKPAEAIDSELKCLTGRHRRSPQLSCRDLEILVCDRIQNILST